MIRALLAVVLAATALAAHPQDALRVEITFWESVRNSTDPADFRAYLDKYPDGQFAALARNRLAALGAKPAAPAAAPAAPAASAAPAAPMRAGPPFTGDRWSYRLVDMRSGATRGTHEVTVSSVGGHTIVEELRTSDGTVQNLEHQPGAYLAPAGNLTVLSPYLAAFSTQPLTVLGRIDNRDARTCKAGWSCSVRGRVMGPESVRTPAGTFYAVRVEIQQSWTTPSQTNDRGETVSRVINVWYAPEAKRLVRATSRGTPSAWVETDYELELVSYQLK